MNIFTIGGSGFVGSRLISLLQKSEQYKITNVDIVESNIDGCKTIIGDVRIQSDIVNALKGADTVILLAAQHRDDVTPISLYYDTNVNGIKNVLHAMEINNVKRIIFFSSVSIYGLNKKNPDENFSADPFNHYGKSKWEAEQYLNEWSNNHDDTIVTIIRPTVIFGENNRGNIYNLLNQITNGSFVMVGDGKNIKSMAYIENIVSFVRFILDKDERENSVYNYADKPDYDMNKLTFLVREVINKKKTLLHFPYWLGMLGGYVFDIVSFITRKKLPISSIRVKKFCSNTMINSDKVGNSGFIAPYSLSEGLVRTIKYEFLDKTIEEE